VMLRIDPRDYQAARDQAAGQLEVAQAQLDNARAALAKARITFPAQLAAARGNLAAAQGQLFKAETDFKRQHAIARAATTQEQVDASTAALQQAQGMVAQAQAQVQEAEPIPENIAQAESSTRQLDGAVAQARAQLAQAELNLSYTVIRAPQDAQPGSAVLSLVTPQVWVTANFKENQLDRMRPGQKVTIDVDAYSDITLHGHVDSVQLGSGSKFTAFPAENATGNFVKIVQRVPVKIIIDSGLDPKFQIPLGLSVTPTVDVGSTPDENAQGAKH
jgi:membrane fusion protein (multidrug efflux system)